MRPIDIGEIIDLLLELRTYSPQMAQRMPHEIELPDAEPIPFLIERLKAAYLACDGVTAKNKPSAFSELTAWLVISYQFYLVRLAEEDNPWMFTFPKSGLETHH